MLWGLVAPAVFLTYGFAFAHAPGARWLGLLWMPWALAGIVFTATMWRSAALRLDAHARPPRKELAWHVLLFLLAVPGSVALALAMRAPVQPPAVVLGGLGAASMIVGAWGLLSRDRAERSIRVVTGAGLVVAAALEVALAGGDFATLAIVGALASFLAFFGSGLLLAMRG
jgi:hypothetical protein